MKSIAFLNNEVQKRMKASMMRTGFSAFEMGYANGYVAVPPGHPLHGLDYDKVYGVADIDVWGGLTFASEKSGCQWDTAYIEVIGDGWFDDIPQDWWVFGFDTMHCNDGPHHDRDWCIRETKQLQEQLDAIKVKPEN